MGTSRRAPISRAAGSAVTSKWRKGTAGRAERLKGEMAERGKGL
jgi:hypothetical protein